MSVVEWLLLIITMLSVLQTALLLSFTDKILENTESIADDLDYFRKEDK